MRGEDLKNNLWSVPAIFAKFEIKRRFLGEQCQRKKRVLKLATVKINITFIAPNNSSTLVHILILEYFLKYCLFFVQFKLPIQARL